MRTHDKSSDIVDHEVDHELDAVEEVRVTESQTRFAPAQIVHALIGAFLVVVGIIAMVRGDLSGDLTATTFDVLGITHNAAIGIAELAAGVLFLLAAAGSFGRFLGVVVGLALVVIAALLVSDDEMVADVGTETALGWLAIALGGAATLVGLIPARRVRRRSVNRSALA